MTVSTEMEVKINDTIQEADAKIVPPDNKDFSENEYDVQKITSIQANFRGK